MELAGSSWPGLRAMKAQAMWPKTVSNRARNTANDLGVFLDCLGCFKCFWGILWVAIIPKWLIKVPGHIAILFG